MKTPHVIKLIEERTQAADELAGAAEHLPWLRGFLAGLPPRQVLALVYSQAWTSVRPLVLRMVAAEYPDSDSLWAWLGQRRQLDWQRVRHFRSRSWTSTKRYIVGELLRRLLPRFPWLRTRHLHLLAFRQDWFEAQACRADAAGQRGWGPLYRHVAIRKPGGALRHIHVPNAVLRAVQDGLLEILRPSLLQAIPTCVHGLGGRQDATQFDNAWRHLGQRHVVSIDLRDFFPTVRAASLVESLLHLEPPAIASHPARRGLSSDPWGLDSYELPLPWTTDAAVLVSRLVTRKGRIPQGATTSPLFASVAFLPLDARIKAAMGRGVVYSRYFDDLTFSVSATVARQRRFTSLSHFRDTVLSIIERVLAPTAFALNARKTTASSDRSGHLVTGLTLSSAGVSLPRQERRRYRALARSLRTRGWVATAAARIDDEEIAIEQGSRSVGTISLPSLRRPGTEECWEDVAVAMLRRLEPEIAISVQHAQDDDGQQSESTVHRGPDAFRILRQLLPMLWETEGLHQAGDEQEVVLSLGERAELRIQGPFVAPYLRLPRDVALRVALLCRRVAGHAAWLSSKDGRADFKSLTALAEELRGAMREASIVVPAGAVPGGADSAAVVPYFATEQAEELRELATSLSDEVEACAELQRDHAAVPRIRELGVHLQRPAETDEELTEWLDSLRSIAIGTLALLPLRPHDPGSGVSNLSHLPMSLEILRLAPDLRSGARHQAYGVEKSSRHLRRVRQQVATPREALAVQLEALREARTMFHGWVDKGRRDPEAWSRRLMPNPHVQNLDARQRVAFEELLEAHASCSTELPSSTRPLPATSHDRLRSAARHLCRRISARTPAQAWGKVCRFAAGLHKETYDQLRSKRRDAWKAALPEDLTAMLRTLVYLRNADAHAPAKGKRRGYRQIVGWAQRSLGLMSPGSWPTGVRQLQELLPISELEAAELRLALTLDVARALKVLATVD